MNQALARVRAEKWTRSCTDSVALKQFTCKYYATQRKARRVNWDKDRLQAIVDDVYQLLSPYAPLEPLHTGNVRDAFSDLHRSAGESFSGEKFRYKSEITDKELMYAEDILFKHGSGIDQKLPKYKIAFRTQIRKVQAKRRVILISPGPLAMIEKKWAYGVQKIMKQHGSPFGSNHNWYQGSSLNIERQFDHPDTKSFDFSSFDHSSPPFLTKMIFDMMERLFVMSPRDTCIFRGICRSHLSAVAFYKNKTLSLKGGIRTGSSFTHVIGTLTGLIMTRYIFGNDVESIHYGDDLLVKTPLSIKRSCELSEKTSFTFALHKSNAGINWLGLKFRRGKWLLADPTKRWAQLFYPAQPYAFTPRVQAALLTCGADPMRQVLLKYLRKKPERATVQPMLNELIYNLNESNPDPSETNIFNLELVMKRFFKLE
uniref:RdRp n=1 Tax=Wenling partiti-like virus 11 TaxID=1923517 RepID=A0A1L3KLP4_9VIRU|nr:RdRp [Wenling partiti-like virus 11]